MEIWTPWETSRHAREFMGPPELETNQEEIQIPPPEELEEDFQGFGGTWIGPLACVRVVRRSRPDMSALPHVWEAIEAFLDCSPSCTMTQAAAFGSMRLLRGISARSAGMAALDPFYKQAQFSGAMQHAAARGDLEMIQWLLNFQPGGLVTKAVEQAARNGQLQVLQWLKEHHDHVFWGANELRYAVEGNHVEVARWLQEQTRPPSKLRAMNLAAANGNLELVQWLFEVRHEASSSAAAKAAKGGFLDMIKWMDKHSLCKHQGVPVEDAAAGGHLKVVKWLHKSGVGIATPRAINAAAANGHLEVVKWLHRKGKEYACTHVAMDDAAMNGHLDVVKWLHSHRHEGCTTDAMDGAARNGHLGVVQWLHSNRKEGCTTRAMDDAAAKGHLHTVMWLNKYRATTDHVSTSASVVSGSSSGSRSSTRRGGGCTTNAMDGAARSNYLDVVKFLHRNREEGCTERAMDGAAAAGHLTMLKWLHEHRNEGCTVAAMDEAATNGHFEIVKWLHDNRIEGCTVRAMDGAAAGGHLRIVKWLHSNRTEGCTEAAMDRAAAHGKLDTLKWLHKNRSEGCTTAAMDRAAAGGHFEVLLFLHTKRSEGCTMDAAVNASRNEHVEILQWFFRFYPRMIHREKVIVFAKRYNYYLMDWLHRNYQASGERTKKKARITPEMTPSAAQLAYSNTQGSTDMSPVLFVFRIRWKSGNSEIRIMMVVTIVPLPVRTCNLLVPGPASSSDNPLDGRCEGELHVVSGQDVTYAPGLTDCAATAVSEQTLVIVEKP
eukprot:jgi/Phyca11/535447/estExt2_fgenesh1_pg.C_PHYCAscaffold_360034